MNPVAGKRARPKKMIPIREVHGSILSETIITIIFNKSVKAENPAQPLQPLEVQRETLAGHFGEGGKTAFFYGFGSFIIHQKA